MFSHKPSRKNNISKAGGGMGSGESCMPGLQSSDGNNAGRYGEAVFPTGIQQDTLRVT